MDSKYKFNEITKVVLSSDVLRSCFFHAFTTQAEEIAGLLLGYVEVQQQNSLGKSSVEVFIYSSICNQRSTKEKDRVEIDPIQLSDAINRAEELSQMTNIQTDVIGWYHSHPNITVFPSQVDINTQWRLQMGGSNFVGLIFSVFVQNLQTHTQSSEVIAFQSYREKSGQIKGRTIPVEIVNVHELLCSLPKPIDKFDFYDNINNIQEVILKEQSESYEEAQRNLASNNLKKITHACNHLLNECRVLETITKPMELVSSSHQSNLLSQIEYMKKEEEILKLNVEELKKRISQLQNGEADMEVKE